jgi:Phage integrase, N-terminal SAM-like domain
MRFLHDSDMNHGDASGWGARIRSKCLNICCVKEFKPTRNTYPNVYPQKQDACDARPAQNANLAVLAATVEKVRAAVELWLSGFSSENTRRAYAGEILSFAAFAEREEVAEAVAHFLVLEDGQAHAVVDAWRPKKLESGLSPSSINRSMSALNSLVASARRHGFPPAKKPASKGVRLVGKK